MRSPFAQLLLALVIGIMTIVGYGVWYSMVSHKSGEVAGIQNQITTATQNVSRITSARAALVQIATNEAKMQNYFVPESGVVAFINDLQASGLAQKATVTVLSVSTGTSGARSTLLLALTIKGTFDAVMRTVGTIEYAPYDISISTLSLAEDAKNSWHADLTLSVGSGPTLTATSTP